MDYFELLDEPRRPWLDPDSLKEKFLRLSSEAHPDRLHNASESNKLTGQERYTAFNAAYTCLREPRDRLRHLLELELQLGDRPKQLESVPADLMSLYLKVGQLCRDADNFLAEKSRITSALVKVKYFERSQEWIEKLKELRGVLDIWREGLVRELKEVDAAWETAATAESPNRRAVLQRLERLYRLFSYLARWSGQVQERLVQLTL